MKFPLFLKISIVFLIATTVPIFVLILFLHNSVLQGEAFVPGESVRKLFFALLALTSACVLGASYAATLVITRPLAKLEEVLRRAGKGDFRTDVKIDTKDELEEIGNHLSSMLSTVKRYQEEAEEARTILEIKVRARTRELQELANSLEEKVQQRTKELEEKVVELQKFKKLAVGRELRMIELKERIQELEDQLWATKARKPHGRTN